MTLKFSYTNDFKNMHGPLLGKDPLPIFPRGDSTTSVCLLWHDGRPGLLLQGRKGRGRATGLKCEPGGVCTLSAQCSSLCSVELGLRHEGGCITAGADAPDTARVRWTKGTKFEPGFQFSRLSWDYPTRYIFFQSSQTEHTLFHTCQLGLKF